MPRYDRVQPCSLDVHSLNGHPLATHRRYEFPEEWAKALRDRVFPSFDPDKPRSIPLWAINQAIAMVLPQVLTHDATARSGKTWLAWAVNDGTPEPDHELLVELVRGGLIAAAHSRNLKAARSHRPPSVDLEALHDVLATFKPEDLRHSIRTLELRPGHELDSVDYTLVAQMLAAHLVGDGWFVEHSEYDERDGKLVVNEKDNTLSVVGHGRSFWRRTAIRDVGAELISDVYTGKLGKRIYPWSFVLQLSLQNIPLDGSLVLHANVDMRRWACSNAFDPNRAVGVHLFTPSPWADATCPVGLASVKWHPGRAGKRHGVMGWNDDLVPILERLTTTGFLPDPAQLLRDPLGHLFPEDGNPALAAVPFRYGLGNNCGHKVGDGVSVRDRKRIFEALVPALKGFATRSEPLTRHSVKTRKRPSSGDILTVNSRDLAAATSDKIELTVWWDTDVMRAEATEAVSEALGMTWPLEPTDSTGSALFKLPGLEVTVHQSPVGDIAAPLHLDTAISDYRDRVSQAVSKRRELVREKMRASEGTASTRLALIEMAGEDAFGRDQDPKQPVKSAAGQVDVLTQNLTPPLMEVEDGKKGGETKSSRKQRTRKAVGDLLTRQSGLLFRPDSLGTGTSPLNDVTPLALWVVRRNNDARAVLPLAVAWLPDLPYATMRLPGRDGGWLPYGQAMRRLATWSTERRFEDEAIHDFFGEVIDEAADGSDVALFTLAQNVRSSCAAMSNGNLQADTLAFHPEKPLAVDGLKGVRHLRLRTNLRHETTQHYAFDSADAEVRQIAGISTGLWAHARHDRLFFSIADKPGSANTSGSPHGSRLEPHWAKVGKDDKGDPVWGWKFETFKDVWNPQMLEVLVALRGDNDDPVAWAAFAHQQRYTAAHFADPLLLPGVMHLAKKAGDYLLPTYEREPLTEKDF